MKITELKLKELCTECVKISEFDISVDSQRIRTCSYCKKNSACLKAEKFLNYISNIYKDNFVKADDLEGYDRNYIDSGGDQLITTSLENIIHECISNKQLITDCINWFENKDTSALLVYNDGRLQGYNNFINDYENLVEEVCHHKRFLNKNVEAFFSKFISLIKSDLVKPVDSNNDIFRARIVHKQKDFEAIKAEPEQNLGAPPSSKTTNQRMTPFGISAFYGSFDLTTCISEVRPVAGSLVASARFRPKENLKLIDISSFYIESDNNYLSDKASKLSQASVFFSHFIDDISKPCVSDDPKEYISSQLFFEYLREKYTEKADGLLYPSVQSKSEAGNIILFPESSGLKSSFLCHLDYSEKIEYVAGSLRFHEIHSIEPMFSVFAPEFLEARNTFIARYF